MDCGTSETPEANTAEAEGQVHDAILMFHSYHYLLLLPQSFLYLH